MFAPFSFFLSIFLIKSVICLEREITVNVDPRREECFFQNAKSSDVIDFEYQVIDGGHGDLDITFHLVDPNGRILAADYKKTENSHRIDATVNGDYKFCFDNTFSAFNVKTVFFELIVEGDDDSEWGSEELDKDGLRPEEMYEVQVEDIQNVVNNVRTHLNRIRHLQEVLKSIEARDRNVVEESFFKVNTYSMVQLILMVAVGMIQVVMVRSLFDEKSRAHRLWKKLDEKR